MKRRWAFYKNSENMKSKDKKNNFNSDMNYSKERKDSEYQD